MGGEGEEGYEIGLELARRQKGGSMFVELGFFMSDDGCMPVLRKGVKRSNAFLRQVEGRSWSGNRL